MFRLSNFSIRWLVIFSVFLNVSIFFIYKYGVDLSVVGVESGGDSSYYHNYALGYGDTATNAWPEILRFLNEIGFYDRGLISWFLYLFYLSIALLAPKLFAISGVPAGASRQLGKRQLALSLLILLYPTLLYYTTDVYRDVFMVAVFTLSIYIVSKIYEASAFVSKLILILFSIFAGWLLFVLREYLGFAFVVALIIPFHVAGKRLLILFVLGAAVLVGFKFYGFLDPLLTYRGEDGFSQGGSTLGIGLVGKNGLEFLFWAFASASFQLFGLYMNSPKAAFVFLVETVPFVFLLAYTIRNRKYMDRFSLYLFYFFIIYGSIWILGNDNLGTSVRLRMFNYLAMATIALRIYSIKISGNAAALAVALKRPAYLRRLRFVALKDSP